DADTSGAPSGPATVRWPSAMPPGRSARTNTATAERCCMKSRDPLTAHHGPAVPRTWPATPSTDTAGQERDQPAIRRRPSPGGQARIRLNRPVRRAVLAAHITSAGAWIGIDVVVAVLVTAGWFGPDPAIRGAA